jgi:hypothetical protein
MGSTSLLRVSNVFIVITFVMYIQFNTHAQYAIESYRNVARPRTDPDFKRDILPGYSWQTGDENTTAMVKLLKYS